MTAMPKDPVMLLSYINTQLRDFYPNLDDLCRSLDVEKDRLCHALGGIDYSYNSKNNQFQ